MKTIAQKLEAQRPFGDDTTHEALDELARLREDVRRLENELEYETTRIASHVCPEPL